MDRKSGKDKGKRPAQAGKKKPSFNRDREDARPSEFEGRRSSTSERPVRKHSEDNGKSFRRKAGDEAGTVPKKRSFDRNAGPGRPASRDTKPDTEKRGRSADRDGKERFAGRRTDEKPFRKGRSESKPGVNKSAKREANPYDLDESDFSYEDRDKKSTGKPFVRKTFKKPSGKPGSKQTANTEGSDDGTIRLNKYIANAGICSRREADELIESGVVQVNGKTITEMGFKVKPTDVIRYGGQTLKREKMVYLILNKPKDYITTVDDPEKRRTVLELVRDACRERIYPVGRLDRATTGLLLFTNDGELTKKLTHPRYGVRKIYHVELDKPLKHSDMTKIAAGISLEDGDIRVDDISYVADGSDKSQVGVELHSGKNRIVRRIFESLGYNVRKLDRVMFGPLTKKDLPRGRWRYLTDAEVGMLKMVSAE